MKVCWAEGGVGVVERKKEKEKWSIEMKDWKCVDWDLFEQNGGGQNERAMLWWRGQVA